MTSHPVFRVSWLPALVSLPVAALGWFDLKLRYSGWSDVPAGAWAGMLGCTVAAALLFRAPGAALLTAWLANLAMMTASVHLTSAHLVALLVSFGAARYGNALVVWLSGLSIALEAGVEVLIFHQDGDPLDVLRVGDRAGSVAHGATSDVLAPLAVAVVTLSTPWLIGLLLRSHDANERSRIDRDVAEARQHEAEARLAHATEVADLRAAQTQMANEVHDVVGHSLAVILAQAESARFLDDDQPDRIREILQHVASAARLSLQDIHAVLRAGGSDAGPASVRVEDLIDGLRKAGRDIRVSVVGMPQPLPHDVEFVAFRVLQEMLTNALRHGLLDAPLWVAQRWENDLQLEVRNVVRPPCEHRPGGGHGVAGMRRRVESVGGRLAVETHDHATGAMFIATASIPLRVP
ncbi:sensor histidine kinase [Aeromicrobium wangtongii]|uniref:histidine kinase n=1 Tax=Aeromicrobium wangtongii TaxID=2969247 RepID=A0ABY5M1F4_9ACTN|nr:histidine kinase [Aeromicrobium wangtongii]MCD9198001.1 histidine kinase [Aeromicrobium wangtongii]UUP12045.1 histidine kinase [Aeromicrobium wangtongii]